MAKTGRDKNTKNKAKHSRLVDQKKNKKRKEAETRKERLSALKQKIKESKSDLDSD